jgi:hypothetical protein
MILLKISASASNNAVQIIFPSMPLDLSRKDRYADNALKMAVVAAGTAAFTVASMVIAGKRASKPSSSRERGLLCLKIPITLLDQNSTFAKQI